ncbi:hypothetical protein TanjilG_15068 [Lupinus angustifolius]|uniref:Uncharacterized protein n=1 Tax=Lupinus angustifolius TaxID=3871 RepID=A0A1J7GZZ6_LUPAN|nr:PREDICTED: uncharacterized protein LOC109353964 [Lupinus angustifolius]OIW06184.1 hypothetical protein TanjilG_15068 [Lupinus angustifolius]
MGKPSALMHLLLIVTFFYATSALPTTQVSAGDKVNTAEKLVNEGIAKTSPKVDDEEAKFKGFYHQKFPQLKKPFYKKETPIYEPLPQPYPTSPFPFFPPHNP